jgi:hypothetical protein
MRFLKTLHISGMPFFRCRRSVCIRAYRFDQLHIDVTPNGTKPNDNWDLLNQNNTKGLVAEVICWDKPDYSKYSNFQGHFCDGVDARAHIPVLKQGDHVRITGKWVKDIGYPKPDHVEWNEIHPVESIQKLP